MSDGFGSVDRPARLYPYRRIVGVGWGGDPIVMVTLTTSTPVSWEVLGFNRPLPPGLGGGEFFAAAGDVVTRADMKQLTVGTWTPVSGNIQRTGDPTKDVVIALQQLWISPPGFYQTQLILEGRDTRSQLFNFKYVTLAAVVISAMGTSNSYNTRPGFPPNIYQAFETFVSLTIQGFATGANFTLNADGTVTADHSPSWFHADNFPTPLSPLGTAFGPAKIIQFDKNGILI